MDNEVLLKSSSVVRLSVLRGNLPLVGKMMQLVQMYYRVTGRSEGWDGLT